MCVGEKGGVVVSDRGLPVTDGHQEIFWRGGEEFKICNVQLFHLDRLTELNNKPERMGKPDSKGEYNISLSQIYPVWRAALPDRYIQYYQEFCGKYKCERGHMHLGVVVWSIHIKHIWMWSGMHMATEWWYRMVWKKTQNISVSDGSEGRSVENVQTGSSCSTPITTLISHPPQGLINYFAFRDAFCSPQLKRVTEPVSLNQIGCQIRDNCMTEQV